MYIVNSLTEPIRIRTCWSGRTAAAQVVVVDVFGFQTRLSISDANQKILLSGDGPSCLAREMSILSSRLPSKTCGMCIRKFSGRERRMRLSVAGAVLLTLCLATLPAVAQTDLYDNGPIFGEGNGWAINFGFAVSDNFTLNSAATIDELQFGSHLFPGDVLESAEVSITSQEFRGTSYFDQNVNFTASNCFDNSFGFVVCTQTGTFNGPQLNAGTYWPELVKRRYQHRRPRSTGTRTMDARWRRKTLWGPSPPSRSRFWGHSRAAARPSLPLWCCSDRASSVWPDYCGVSCSSRGFPGLAWVCVLAGANPATILD